MKMQRTVFSNSKNGTIPFVFGSILNAMKDYYPEVLDYSAEMYIRTAKTGGGGHPNKSY